MEKKPRPRGCGQGQHNVPAAVRPICFWHCQAHVARPKDVPIGNRASQGNCVVCRQAWRDRLATDQGCSGKPWSPSTTLALGGSVQSWISWRKLLDALSPRCALQLASCHPFWLYQRTTLVTLEFLRMVVGLDTEYIVRRPTLLGFSMKFWYPRIIS